MNRPSILGSRNLSRKAAFILSAALISPGGSILADVKLPPLISDHMVLQKTASTPVWGKADPGEKVTVTLDGRKGTATADGDGRWRVVLNLANSGPGPFELSVEGKNQLTVSDVAVGDVWLASGQSNMEFKVKEIIDISEEVAQSANPMLRQFVMVKATPAKPVEDFQGWWMVASPENTPNFSAVAYYFGKTVQKATSQPIGLIYSSWGGTPSEAWTSKQSLDTVPDLKSSVDRVNARIEQYPGALAAWVKNFGAWLKTSRREDKTPDPAPYLSGSTEGWTPVQLPGVVSGKGLPEAGAVWLRKTVDVPVEKSKGALIFELGPINGFDAIYWNGELIKKTDYLTYPGVGYSHRWDSAGTAIPASKVKVGPSSLAIRLYAPVGPIEIPRVTKLGGVDLAGEWLAKAEFSLPALSAEQKAKVPVSPEVLPKMEFTATRLFNGMIAPLLPYAIKGVIWYQGEANVKRAVQYQTAFPLLIADWRKAWNQKNLPFYFCQLANFLPKNPVPGDSAWAELREAQSLALKVPNTGTAVLIDVGEASDIHPLNKKAAGERLAAVALARTYGKSIPFSGPVLKSSKVEGDKIRLTFTHTDQGLVARPVPETYDVVKKAGVTAPTVRNSPDSQLEGFAICGEDRKWVWADARIEGDTVVVWSDKVLAPVAVRYGWAENPTVNLYNGAGFPASPLRTDDFPLTTANVKL